MIITSLNYPILQPFRVIQEKAFGNIMFDLSPVFALIALSILKGIFI